MHGVGDEVLLNEDSAAVAASIISPGSLNFLIQAKKPDAGLGKSPSTSAQTSSVKHRVLACGVCKKPVEELKAIILECGHSFHKDCIARDLIAQIDSAIFPVICGVSDCEQEPSMYLLSTLVPRHHFQASLDFEHSLCPEIQENKCFSCSQRFLSDCEVDVHHCLRCRQVNCLKCHSKYHPGVPCAEEKKKKMKEISQIESALDNLQKQSPKSSITVPADKNMSITEASDNLATSMASTSLLSDRRSLQNGITLQFNEMLSEQILRKKSVEVPSLTASGSEGGCGGGENVAINLSHRAPAAGRIARITSFVQKSMNDSLLKQVSLTSNNGQLLVPPRKMSFQQRQSTPAASSLSPRQPYFSFVPKPKNRKVVITSSIPPPSLGSSASDTMRKQQLLPSTKVSPRPLSISITAYKSILNPSQRTLTRRPVVSPSNRNSFNSTDNFKPVLLSNQASTDQLLNGQRSLNISRGTSPHSNLYEPEVAPTKRLPFGRHDLRPPLKQERQHQPSLYPQMQSSRKSASPVINEIEARLFSIRKQMI